MAMHTELWFPSVIWSSVIHVVDNAEVKSFAYHLQENNQGRTVSNYGGFQSQNLMSLVHTYCYTIRVHKM